MAKMDTSLYDELSKIAAKRFSDGLDKKYSPPTVQRKILRHPFWPRMKVDLQSAEFLKDEKAQFTFDFFSIFRFVIVAFVAVVFFGGLMYVMGLLNTSFLAVGAQNEGNSGQPGYVNLTDASERTFGQVNQSIQGLRLVAICLIFAEILLIFVLNSFMRIHPAFFFIWIFVVFLAVLFAAPISNAYESLLQARVYDGLLASFTGANWLILNLPLVTALVGILGGIFMFINIVRSGGEQVP